MVRTRGLGHALGRVIGRALGQDHHDPNDVPQRHRPIASTCRQREAAPVAEDVPEMMRMKVMMMISIEKWKKNIVLNT